MIKIIKKIIPYLVVYGLMAVILCFNVSSVTAEDTNAKGTVVELGNPLLNMQTKGIPPEELYGRIIYAFLSTVGMAALVMFVVGGYFLLTSAGNPEKIKKGKETMVWAAIGVALTLSSYIILRYIIQAITKTAGG